MVHDPEMADLLENFAAEHPDAVIRHGGEIFVAAEAVSALIAEAEHRGVGILGMEGFLIDGEDVYPSLDRIADFSAGSGSPRSVTESIALAREVLSSSWRLPPGPADQMHPKATGRHMIAVVTADSAID